MGWISALLSLSILGQPQASIPSPKPWDTRSDTWAATDRLGRTLPEFAEVGPRRRDKFVGMFYFLWSGSFNSGGPYDVSKILASDPLAMSKPTMPPWGGVFAPHHWGEPLFGYYVDDDDFVLRKHAQMLSDAGVDVIIFDTSNDVTYKPVYMRLLEVFRQVRAAGGRTPQIAFLCPFGTPGRVVRELYRDLYAPGLYPELWFQWRGKPLILADPVRLGVADANSIHLEPVDMAAADVLTEEFTASAPFVGAAPEVATYAHTDSAATVSLLDEAGRQLASKRFENVADNGYLKLRFRKPLPAGKYQLRISQSKGRFAWWGLKTAQPGVGPASVNGKPSQAHLSINLTSPEPNGIQPEDFFTFRAPQPSYFAGPTKPDMWSWLEVHPQHTFTDSRGAPEQVSVGVAQNAVDGRLGSMSEKGSHGRGWHDGHNDSAGVAEGLNFKEQFERALKLDPEFIFVTGWNEWIAGRFEEFSGVREPVMFVDEFNQEFSRDIEPMRGGHADNYYYQLVSFIRRYKGVSKPPKVGGEKSINLDGPFSQWDSVAPEFRDDSGDAARRDYRGWDPAVRYVNTTGRNDFVSMKVSRDRQNLYFYARTASDISRATDSHWMMMFLKIAGSSLPNWEGYSFVLNRVSPDATDAVLEQSQGGWKWAEKAKVKYRVLGREIMVQIPLSAFGDVLNRNSWRLEFKWFDNMQHEGDASDFDQYGDAAPNGRFNYIYSVGSGSGS